MNMKDLAKRLDDVCRKYTDVYNGNAMICRKAIRDEPEKVIEFLVTVMETSLKKMEREVN